MRRLRSQTSSARSLVAPIVAAVNSLDGESSDFNGIPPTLLQASCLEQDRRIVIALGTFAIQRVQCCDNCGH